MSKKRQNQTAPRNRYAFDPIMRKGGYHGKTRKAERRQAKQNMATKWADLTVPVCS